MVLTTIRGNGDRILLAKDGQLVESFNNAYTTGAYAEGWEDVTGHPVYEAQCTESRDAASAAAAP